MNNNRRRSNKPQRKKIPTIDLAIIALGVLVILRIDWANMNSFHYLIMFLFVLCLMLRWANMRKENERKQKIAQYKAAKEALETTAEPPSEEGVSADAEVSADEISAEAKEIITDDVPAKEKTEE